LKQKAERKAQRKAEKGKEGEGEGEDPSGVDEDLAGLEGMAPELPSEGDDAVEGPPTEGAHSSPGHPGAAEGSDEAARRS
jgi:hypothetical protein